MNRRQLAFIVIVNGLVSLIIALLVVWVYEIRRPEAEELAALYVARPDAVIAARPAPSNPVAATTDLQQEGPAPEPPAAVPQPESEPQDVYVVRGGDSLVAIAARYNVTVDQIVAENKLANPDFVFSGQRLVIPSVGGVLDVNASVKSADIAGVEINAIDSAGDIATESVQIVNDSDQAFSLQGWRLVREGGPTYSFRNVPFFPGGSVRVNTRAGEDTSVTLYWGLDEAQWPSGSIAQLMNERGAVVHWVVIP